MLKKQVLIFSHGYNAPFVDVCNQYAATFDRSQYEINTVYLVGAASEEIKRKTLADHVYFLDKGKHTRGLKLSIVKSVLQVCYAKQFSIIICHRYKPIYIISLASLFIEIPKIFGVLHELGALKRRSRQLFVAWLARKKIKFVAVSNAVREDILRNTKFLNTNDVIVLPNGLDVRHFKQQLLSREQARQVLSLGLTDFVFGNIGRLVKNKDQISLIKAFADVAGKFPQTKLVIMGTGQLAATLKQLVKQYKLEDRIIFTGFVIDAFRYVKAFDAYVSSSMQEAFGRVLIEAMVGSVPVIATCVHGVPEVIGEVGVLAPAKQPEALAEAMGELIMRSQEQLNALGQLGYDRV